MSVILQSTQRPRSEEDMAPRWGNNFSIIASWLRVGESAEWVADGCMIFMSMLSRSVGQSGWRVLSMDGGEGRDLGWNGSGVDLTVIFDDWLGASPTYDSLRFKSSGEHPIRFDVDAGAFALAGRRIFYHRTWIDVEGRSEEAGNLTPALVAAVVGAWDPAFVCVTDANLGRLEDKKNLWRVRPGYIVWINDAIGAIEETADRAGVEVERVGDGSMLTVDNKLTVEQTYDAVMSLYRMNSISDLPRDLLQSMEVPSRGVVPESVEVGEGFRPAVSVDEGEYEDPAELYRQQISGWLLNEQGEAPYWVQPEPSTEIPVRYVGHTWRGDTEVFLHAVYGNDRFGDPTDDLAVLSAPRLLSVASWQVSVLPEGGVLEWHASTSSAATGLRNFFAVHGLSQLRVVHTPAVEGSPDE